MFPLLTIFVGILVICIYNGDLGASYPYVLKQYWLLICSSQPSLGYPWRKLLDRMVIFKDLLSSINLENLPFWILLVALFQKVFNLTCSKLKFPCIFFLTSVAIYFSLLLYFLVLFIFLFLPKRKELYETFPGLSLCFSKMAGACTEFDIGCLLHNVPRIKELWQPIPSVLVLVLFVIMCDNHLECSYVLWSLHTPLVTAK